MYEEWRKIFDKADEFLREMSRDDYADYLLDNYVIYRFTFRRSPDFYFKFGLAESIMAQLDKIWETVNELDDDWHKGKIYLTAEHYIVTLWYPDTVKYFEVRRDV